MFFREIEGLCLRGCVLKAFLRLRSFLCSVSREVVGIKGINGNGVGAWASIEIPWD